MGQRAAQFFVFLLLGFSSLNVRALTVDTSLFYISDSLSISTNTTNTKILGDLAVTIKLDKKGQWFVGWAYNYISISESGTTTSEFGLTEMGPRFGYYIDKQKIWSLTFTYNLQSTADYSSGGTSAEWRGTSMKGEVGYTPPISETVHAGIKLNYYQANFSEQFVNTTTFSTISNSRSIIYPSIAFIYHWN